MYSFDRFVKGFFRLFDCFISKKYVTEDNKFIRDIKMTQKEYTAYILFQRSCTAYIRVIRFFTIILSNNFKTIFSQAIRKQRMYIDLNVFIDMYELYINKLYDKFSDFSKFKGYIIVIAMEVWLICQMLL